MNLQINIGLVEGKDLVLYGTGQAARRTLSDLKEAGCRVLCFVDNNPDLWGTRIEGLEVKNPDFFFQHDERENRLIVICSMYHFEMEQKLIAGQLEAGKDYIVFKSLYQLPKLPIQDELDRLIAKYGFAIDSRPQSFVMVEDIQETILELPSHWNIAIWGDSEHTEHLLNLIKYRAKIDCIVDLDVEKQGELLDGIPIVDPEALEGRNIQVVIISSKANRAKIKDELINRFPSIKVIDLYSAYDDILVMETSFYSIPDVYIEFLNPNLLRYKLEAEADQKKQLKILKRYLGCLLHIKEFDLFDKTVKTYCDPKKPGTKKWILLNNELKQLLQKIYQKVQSRKQEDIIWFMIDSLRQQELHKSPFLKSLSDQALFIPKSYSPSTYTRASYVGMFSGKPFTLKQIMAGTVDGEGSRLFEWLSKRGYRMFQNGGPTIQNVPLLEHLYTEKVNWFPYTIRWWETLCRLYTYDEPQFHLLHLFEAHQPFLSANQKGLNLLYHPEFYFRDNRPDQTGSIGQYEEALAYLDHQLSLSVSILPEQTTLIVSGDHGAGLGGDVPTGHIFGYSEGHINVPLIIRHPSIQARRIDGLFSCLNIQQLLVDILQEGRVNPSLLDKNVLVLREAIYSPKYRSDQEFVRNAGDLLHAFAIVISNGYKYVRLASGEKLFRLGDDTTNLAERSDHRDVLDQLRNLLKDEQFTGSF